MPCVTVITSDRRWTMRATHLACAMARSLGVGIQLVKMVPVPMPGHLGASYIHPNDNDPDMRAMPEFLATAEDYGVAAEVIYLHYAGYVSGLVSGVEQLGSLAVFAAGPSRGPAIWRRFRRWQLVRAVKVPLYTLDDDQKVIAPATMAEDPVTETITVPGLASRLQ